MVSSEIDVAVALHRVVLQHTVSGCSRNSRRIFNRAWGILLDLDPGNVQGLQQVPDREHNNRIAAGQVSICTLAWPTLSLTFYCCDGA